MGRLFLTSLFATKIRWGLVEEELVVLSLGLNQPEALKSVPLRNPWGSTCGVDHEVTVF
jgi:hypothetical protein